MVRLARLGFTEDMNETLEDLRTPLLVAATVLAGLQAGTYYVFASGVMPGLSSVDDRTFVASLQQVNVAIVNPVFMASFLGAPLLAVAAAVAYAGHPAGRSWVIAGAVLALATVVVTIAGNVPLNDALEAAGKVDRIQDLAAVREHFESAWVRWNVVRTLTSTAALACFGWAATRTG